MVDNKPSHVSVAFSEEQKAALKDLVAFTNLDIREEVLDILLELLQLGTAPSQLIHVLKTLGKPALTPSSARVASNRSTLR